MGPLVAPNYLPPTYCPPALIGGAPAPAPAPIARPPAPSGWASTFARSGPDPAFATFARSYGLSGE